MYQGNPQVLDHILTSSALPSYEYDIVHAEAFFDATDRPQVAEPLVRQRRTLRRIRSDGVST
ncbi:hypothetical protein [Streptomyces sp. NBC_01764]|uniref:hypothetical protein n=1 Tax=Streptomyces sp. NBC_01764 TaxID=2975935 RepID=UPI002B1CBB5E|nr:hypothetical protein [Streptomyces sp. NBC_01764]